MINTLQIILYILGSILLAVLIILGIKLIITINKVNVIADDVYKKVKTLDGFFALVDYTTDKISTVSDKIVSFTTSLISKIFNKKESEEKENE